MKKNQKKGLLLALILMITALPTIAYAAGIEAVKTPTGFMAFVTIIPLVLVLTLLFLKVDMIIAGLAGGVLAMLIGGIGLAEANTQFLETIPTMLSITVPIINSAIAMAVFKSGGYTAALTLA